MMTVAWKLFTDTGVVTVYSSVILGAIPLTPYGFKCNVVVYDKACVHLYFLLQTENKFQTSLTQAKYLKVIK